MPKGIKWSDEEVEYLSRRVSSPDCTIQKAVDELNQMYPGRNRTYNGARGVLRRRGTSVPQLRAVRPLIKEKSEEELAQLRGEGTMLDPGYPDEPEMTQEEEEELRRKLCERGYKVEKLSPDKKDLDIDVSQLFEGEKMRFAVISCTQIGSKYQQLTHLRAFYRLVDSRGIKVVFHCGDLVDGVNVYKGHEYELFLHGEKAQRDYCVEKYPRLENGGKTLVIAGNHDYSFMKAVGCDVVANICDRRDDMEYLGAYGAFPTTEFLRVYLQHGKGGGAYARSYKMQKFIEQMAPEIKPDLYFLGHYHTTCALFEYRNVTAFMMGCFQAQTPHLRQFGLFPEIGGLIMEVTINEKTRKQTLADMKFEWVPFYIPLENDF